MRKYNAIWFPAVLLTVSSCLFTLRALGDTPPLNPSGCNSCVPDGCNLEPGEFLVALETDHVYTCIDFDGDGIGHCSLTERQKKDIYRHYPADPDPTHGYSTGNCFKEYCPGASPTDNLCPYPYSPSGNPVGFSQAPAGGSHASTAGASVCTLHGGQP